MLFFMPPATATRHSSSTAQDMRGINQRHVRERLREIAQHASCARIVFLREQADIVPQGRAGARTVARASSRWPIRCRQSASQNVQSRNTPSSRAAHRHCWSRAIAEDETILRQFALDRFDRAAHARIVRRQETHQRHHEQAGVELRRSHKPA